MQDIGYSKLANLAPQYGLCKFLIYILSNLTSHDHLQFEGFFNGIASCSTDSSFVPPLIYAAMGSSRDIAIGPVAVVSLLLGTLIQDEFDPVKQKLDYQRLAFTATFFAGLTQFALGFFRYF